MKTPRKTINDCTPFEEAVICSIIKATFAQEHVYIECTNLEKCLISQIVNHNANNLLVTTTACFNLNLN